MRTSKIYEPGHSETLPEYLDNCDYDDQALQISKEETEKLNRCRSVRDSCLELDLIQPLKIL